MRSTIEVVDREELEELRPEVSSEVRAGERRRTEGETVGRVRWACVWRTVRAVWMLETFEPMRHCRGG